MAAHMTGIVVIGAVFTIFAALIIVNLLVDKGVDVAALGVERLTRLGTPDALVILSRPPEDVCVELQRAGRLTQNGELAIDVGVPVELRPSTGGQPPALDCRWAGRADETRVLQAVKASVQTVDPSARIVVK